MKTLLFLTIALCSGFLSAQDYPGKHIELLEGKQLKVLPLTVNKKGYYGFYSNPTLTKIYKKTDVIFTKKEAVEGKVFKVVSCKPNSSMKYNYVIELSNVEIGTIYYGYNDSNGSDYNFEIAIGEDFPEEIYCEQLRGSGGSLYWSGSNVERNARSVDLPLIEGIEIRYFPTQSNKYSFNISFNQASATRENDIKEATIFLQNGTEIKVQSYVSVEPSGTIYRYGSILNLTKEQWDKLKESPVVKVALGKHENNITRGKLIQHYIKCVESK